MKALYLSRFLYVALLLILALVAGLSELDILHTGYVCGDAETEYMLHMLCVVLTLGGTWSALRLFAFKRIRSKIDQAPEILQQWNLVRICIIGLPLLLNLIIYYALLSGTTPLYCFFITLLGYVFCWPKKEE